MRASSLALLSIRRAAASVRPSTPAACTFASDASSVDVVGACASEDDVEASKRFFPRYDGSAKFPRAKKRRKRRRRRKEL